VNSLFCPAGHAITVFIISSRFCLKNGDSQGGRMNRSRFTCLPVALAMSVAVVLPAAATTVRHVAFVACTGDPPLVRTVPVPPRISLGDVGEWRVGRHRRATERECRAGRGDEDHYHTIVGHRHVGDLWENAPGPRRTTWHVELR
jgi:hypothetical protein